MVGITTPNPFPPPNFNVGKNTYSIKASFSHPNQVGSCEYLRVRILLSSLV